MATQVSKPIAQPFTTPTTQGGSTPTVSGNPNAVPKPGALVIPQNMEPEHDTFSPTELKAPPNTPTQATGPKFGSHHAQPKFGGTLRTAAAFGLGGIAALSAAVCIPAAVVTGIVGLFLHPLLPLAGIIGLIPVGLGALALVVGKSGGK